MPKFTISIPVETCLLVDVEAATVEEAIAKVDAGTASYISNNEDGHTGFEFDHRGDIEEA